MNYFYDLGSLVHLDLHEKSINPVKSEFEVLPFEFGNELAVGKDYFLFLVEGKRFKKASVHSLKIDKNYD